jgi:membrane protein implicated in regulation of membrane protease activity
LIVGIGLFIAELFGTNFLLATLGLGCVASAIASLLTSDIRIQILTFCVASLVVFIAVRPTFLKILYSRSTDVKTNVDALPGKIGMVSEAIDPHTGKGRVVVEGEDWRGASIDGIEIPQGGKVVVVKVEGTRLVVKPLPPRKED